MPKIDENDKAEDFPRSDQAPPAVEVTTVQSLLDIPWERSLELPRSVYLKLKAKTDKLNVDQFDLIRSIRKSHEAVASIRSECKARTRFAEDNMVKMYQSIREQKREIKALLKAAGVKIKPGSRLSVLLRLDNIGG